MNSKFERPGDSDEPVKKDGIFHSNSYHVCRIDITWKSLMVDIIY